MIPFDEKLARATLPDRPRNGHKGTFGKVLVIAGSETYPGAAHLAVEGALRSGVGYVHFAGGRALSSSLLLRFPEVIFHPLDTGADRIAAAELSLSMDATLFGPGAGRDNTVRDLVLSLLSRGETPLILDADALSVIREEDLAASCRPTLVTPHPKEFERLSGIPVPEDEREKIAAEFARRTGAVLLLKGHGTVTTDGDLTYLNTTGNTALSKGGSGDVLAGLVAGLAGSHLPLIKAAALGAYLHGKAAETLSSALSPFGVTPSDLPVAIAGEIRNLL